VAGLPDILECHQTCRPVVKQWKQIEKTHIELHIHVELHSHVELGVHVELGAVELHVVKLEPYVRIYTCWLDVGDLFWRRKVSRSRKHGTELNLVCAECGAAKYRTYDHRFEPFELRLKSLHVYLLFLKQRVPE
jgi:hypothetical protein